VTGCWEINLYYCTRCYCRFWYVKYSSSAQAQKEGGRSGECDSEPQFHGAAPLSLEGMVWSPVQSVSNTACIPRKRHSACSNVGVLSLFLCLSPAINFSPKHIPRVVYHCVSRTVHRQLANGLLNVYPDLFCPQALGRDCCRIPGKVILRWLRTKQARKVGERERKKRDELTPGHRGSRKLRPMCLSGAEE
jgi:hypothetical protein